METFYNRSMQPRPRLEPTLAEVDQYCPNGHPKRINKVGDLEPRLPCATCTRLNQPAVDSYHLSKEFNPNQWKHQEILTWKLQQYSIRFETGNPQDPHEYVCFFQWERME